MQSGMAKARALRKKNSKNAVESALESLKPSVIQQKDEDADVPATDVIEVQQKDEDTYVPDADVIEDLRTRKISDFFKPVVPTANKSASEEPPRLLELDADTDDSEDEDTKNLDDPNNKPLRRRSLRSTQRKCLSEAALTGAQPRGRKGGRKPTVNIPSARQLNREVNAGRVQRTRAQVEARRVRIKEECEEARTKLLESLQFLTLRGRVEATYNCADDEKLVCTYWSVIYVYATLLS